MFLFSFLLYILLILILMMESKSPICSLCTAVHEILFFGFFFSFLTKKDEGERRRPKIDDYMNCRIHRYGKIWEHRQDSNCCGGIPSPLQGYSYTLHPPPGLFINSPPHSTGSTNMHCPERYSVFRDIT